MIYSKFNDNFTIKIYGSSHDEAIYLDIFGLPKNYKIDMNLVNLWLEERRSKISNKLSTNRREKDLPLIYNEETGEYVYQDTIYTQEKMRFMINNTDVRSEDYQLRYPRPNHCDIVAYDKYKNTMNLNGGGIFSGRMTALLVLAGSISWQMLCHHMPNLKIGAKLISLGKLSTKEIDYIKPEDTQDINIAKNRDYLDSIIKEGDSLGGSIMSYVSGLESSIGGPLFDGLDAQISQLLFCIPGMKAVEFGNGTLATSLKGSENNDQILSYEKGQLRTYTNNSGGILAGMTNSMPLVVKAHFKPTPSIAKKQTTIDLFTGKPYSLQISGRHDIAYVTRTLPCVKSAISIALLNSLLSFKAFHKRKLTDKLEAYRYNIDEIDTKIINLLEERMDISRKIGEYKNSKNLNIFDSNREEEVLNSIPSHLKNIFKEIVSTSKEQQKI